MAHVNDSNIPRRSSPLDRSSHSQPTNPPHQELATSPGNTCWAATLDTNRVLATARGTC